MGEKVVEGVEEAEETKTERERDGANRLRREFMQSRGGGGGAGGGVLLKGRGEVCQA